MKKTIAQGTDWHLYSVDGLKGALFEDSAGDIVFINNDALKAMVNYLDELDKTPCNKKCENCACSS